MRTFSMPVPRDVWVEVGDGTENLVVQVRVGRGVLLHATSEGMPGPDETAGLTLSMGQDPSAYGGDAPLYARSIGAEETIISVMAG